jgi:hypothetical protein
MRVPPFFDDDKAAFWGHRTAYGRGCSSRFLGMVFGAFDCKVTNGRIGSNTHRGQLRTLTPSPDTVGL